MEAGVVQEEKHKPAPKASQVNISIDQD